MQKLAHSILPLVAFFVHSTPVEACKCEAVSARLLYQTADVVAIGTGKALTGPGKSGIIDTPVSFRADKVFKGNAPKGDFQIERAKNLNVMCQSFSSTAPVQAIVFLQRTKDGKVRLASDCYGDVVSVSGNRANITHTVRVPIDRLGDYFGSKADGVGKVCDTDIDCKDVSCSLLDSGVKTGYRPACIQESIPNQNYKFCACLCRGCH